MQKSSTKLSSPKNILKKMTFGLIFFTLPFSSFSQDDSSRNISLASITDHTKEDGFVQVFGINLDYKPAFRGSDKYGVEIQGGGAIQYKNGKHLFFLEGFDIDGAELGWRSMVTNNWLLQAGLRHETVLPSSDLKQAKIEGMPHRGSTVFGFVEANYLFGKNERYWLSGRLSAGPSDFGYRAKFSVGHRLGRSADSSLDLLAYSTFGDKEQFDRYFGISAQESISSGLNQTDLGSGYRSSGVEFLYRQNLLSNIQILAKVGVEVYSSEIEKSALVSGNAEITSELSIVWRFW